MSEPVLVTVIGTGPKLYVKYYVITYHIVNFTTR